MNCRRGRLPAIGANRYLAPAGRLLGTTPLMHPSPQVPPLCAGDTLTRAEFERRYAAMPEVKKAELIEGVVYLPAPVRYTTHGHPHALLSAWLAAYAETVPGVEASANATLRLDGDNVPQPDLLLRVATSHGVSRLDADGFLVGPPELIVEIAASSTSYDLHQKLHVYRRAGVQEYIVVRPADSAVDWFALHHGSYERLVADARGVLHSRAFPGLRLDVPALLRLDSAALRAQVEHGAHTAEHAAFCARIRE